MRTILVTVLTIIGALTMWCGDVFARCGPMQGPTISFWGSTAVFVGRVTNIRVDGYKCLAQTCAEQVTFSVRTAFKNANEPQIVLANEVGSHEQRYEFKVGSTYLVYAGRDHNSKELRATGCGRTTPIEKASEDLKVLRELTKTTITSRSTPSGKK